MAVPAEAITQPAQGHIQGDVVVATGVAIAPQVFLSAASGCRLVIAPGVCLGSDVILQAQGGDLVIEPGVNLGSGVLVVGHGAIGQHTCVGANSTLINPVLGPSQVVAPGSLIGALAQPDLPTESSAPRSPAPDPAAPSFVPLPDPWNGNGNGATVAHNSQGGNVQNGSGPKASQVYGKAQVNRMLASLFPQRPALNGSKPELSPEASS